MPAGRMMRSSTCPSTGMKQTMSALGKKRTSGKQKPRLNAGVFSICNDGRLSTWVNPADLRSCTRGWIPRDFSLGRRQSCHRARASYCHQLGSLAPSHDDCVRLLYLARARCAESASKLKRDLDPIGCVQKDIKTPRNRKMLEDNRWVYFQQRCHSRQRSLEPADVRILASLRQRR